MSELFADLPLDVVAKWVTKSDRAYGAIRHAIVSGRLKAGEQINPKAVADELEMSIIPVREALRRLEQEQLVVIRPHVGATVRAMPADEITENLLIRSTLEGLAAELATPLLTEDALERLAEIAERMGECVERGKLDEIGSLNREFHAAIYEVIPEKRLVRLIEQQWDLYPEGTSVFSLVPDHTAKAHKEHVAIVAALKKKDAALAARLMREHKMRARKVHREALGERSPRELTPAE